MIQSTLLISSKDYYSCQITRNVPVRISIVAIRLPEGFAIVEPLENSKNALDDYVSEMQTSPSVKELEITYRSSDVCWTRVIHQLDFPSIYETVLETGNMTVFPLVIEKGLQYHDILSPTPGHFGRLLEVLKERFSDVRIKHLSSKPVKKARSLLTPKQLEALQLAYKAGYYEIPRQVKISDLALKAGIKRVAMQERLRRAELRILTDYARKIPELSR